VNPTISFIFVDFGLKCSIGQVGLENWISGKSGLTPQNIGQAGQPPEPNQKRWEVAVQERHGVALEQEGRDHGNDVQTEVPAAPNSVFRMNDRIVGPIWMNTGNWPISNIRSIPSPTGKVNLSPLAFQSMEIMGLMPMRHCALGSQGGA